MSKLSCEDFSVKYFGYDESISGISTDFFDGLNVIYAGEKNGKTTFLKALAGVIPSSGKLILDDEEYTNEPLKNRDFQMVFDDYAFFERRTARYNLEYPLKIRKISKTERRERVESVLSLFDLDLMIDAPVYRLNEWLKVSLALCRAYLRAPKVLLIDNVFSRLDPISRKEAVQRYLPLLSENRIVIYATDDPREATALSEKIKLLSCGYLLQEGSAQDFSHKSSCMTAFLSFNLFPTTISCTLSDHSIVVGKDEIKIAIPELIGSNYIGTDLIAGFLPEDFSEDPQGISMVVKGCFFDGERKIYRLDWEKESVFAALPTDYPIGTAVKILPTRIATLFDSINQRTVIRY